MTRTNQIVSLFTGVLVAFLGLAAFVLSFDALRSLAAASGINDGMAWLYPAIIDGAIIIFSLSVLQASLNREQTRYPWALVGLFTVLSIGLNILHAPTFPLPRLLAAIPPIALFLSFELLMSQVKGLVHRLGSVQTLQELTAAVQQKQAELDNLITQKRTELDSLIAHRKTELEAVVAEKETAVSQLDVQVDKLTAKKEDLLAELKTLRQQKRGDQLSNLGILDDANAVRLSNKEAAIDALLDYLADNPDASLSDIADNIGRSRSTAGNYVNELTANGRLYKNGHGWEIHDLA